MIAIIAKYVLMAVVMANAFSVVLIVGRPRKPVTSGVAAYVVLFAAVWCVLIYAYWGTR